jgi:D-lactate dehydrogenase
MKIIVYSAKNFEKKYLIASNKSEHELSFYKESLSVRTCENARGYECVSIFSNDDASAPVLEKLKKLGVKFIAVRAAGYDQVDIPYAKKLGIRIANVPEYSPYAIAEHAVAMMLALNRKIVGADKNVKNYNFVLDDQIGFDMNEKTVGIIGVGKIGAIVARILYGFGCRLLAYDISRNEDLIKKYGLKYCTLDELAADADIITIHAPLNSQTKHLINKSLLNKMRQGVMLINTGRGGIINTADVIEALKTGRIGHLGLDVYEYEKELFFYDHSPEILQDDLFARLLTFKNVLVTGHQAFLTETALKNIADTTIHNIDCWQKGLPSPNEL